MRKINGVLLVMMLLINMSCEEVEKKSSQVNRQTKGAIQRIPDTTDHHKTDKKNERIIPQEIPVVRLDPGPPDPGPFPYYWGEPPISCPTIEPIALKSDTIFDFDTKMPEFPNGMSELQKYLSKNLIYPSVAMEMGIEGTVIIQFVVYEDGSIHAVRVLKGINEGMACDKEAVRLIQSMPNWNPGINEQGQAVKVRVNLPVRFRLI